MKHILLSTLLICQQSICMQMSSEKPTTDEEENYSDPYASLDLTLKKILASRAKLEKNSKQINKHKKALDPFTVGYAEHNALLIEKYLDSASQEKERAKVFLNNDLSQAMYHLRNSYRYANSAQLLIKKCEKEIKPALNDAQKKHKQEKSLIQAKL